MLNRCVHHPTYLMNQLSWIRNRPWCLALLLVFGAVAGRANPTIAQETSFNAQQLEFFESKVRPLLIDKCHSCHSLAEQENQGGLLLDSRAAILKGGDTGEAIVPGKPEESLLISAVKYEDYEMPPSGELPEEEIAILEKWVEMGAPWPAEKDAGGPALEEFDLEARRKEHWVWQPVMQHPTPAVESPRWSRTSIDQFIYSKLEAQQLEPSDQADPLAIARRLHMDLIGLPPTTEELATFKQDLTAGRGKAIENLTDRLLDSPHFGERWGRHWLDLTRYAESCGHEFDNDIPNAFQYRDYLIRAFNADVPYDQFVREHIAGDLLTETRVHPEKKFNESILGTGFWFLGESVHSPVDILKDESDRFDNMIDVASKSFLGMTVSCARCHDHKFDAISTADYYSLTGFLQSSDYRQVRFESIEQNKKVAAKLSKIDQRYQDKILKLLEGKGINLPDQTDQLSDEHIIFDFATLPQSQYLQDGFIFGARPQRAGRIYFQAAGGTPEFGIATYDSAINDPFWNRLESVTEGLIQDKNSLTKVPRSGRTLRTPTFELKEGKVSCLVSGKGNIIACVDSHRLINGPLHRQTIKAFDFDSTQKWVALDLDRYVGHRLHLEFVPAESQQISVRLAAQGLDDEAKVELEKKLDQLDEGNIDFAKKAGSLLQIENSFERVVFEDFENGYGDWVAEGEAFGDAPQSAETAGPELKKVNHVDKFFVNSFKVPSGKGKNKKEKKAIAKNGFALTGTLTSPEFKIDCDTIEFMVGGGSDKETTCVNLVVDGKVELTATGRGNSKMFLHNWDVSHLKGKQAVIAVVDNNKKRGGNIEIDHIVFASRTNTNGGDTAFSKIFNQWHAERKELSTQLVLSSRLAPAMLDGTGEEANVYIRGNSSKPGKLEPRHFLTAVGGEPMQVGTGSGRLQLAEKINDPKNPLTSRVIVNRLWHYLMGRGLVPTTDDFGVLGQRPTHPKLLDHLASEFVADGQSIKRMIKRIVLTETYQMASRPNAQSLATDPKNLLWHHRPPRRLEGEIIRDSLLALSGRLDKTQQGTPVPIHLTSFMDGRGRPGIQGPLDGDGRRSIYIAVRRNFISPFMIAFDTPVPFSTMGRRNVSNVPAQALILMNDPFVAEQAKKWAQRSLSVEEKSQQRVQWMYQSAFGRLPTEAELKTSLEFVEDGDDVETWTHFAHALINTKEFIFLR